MKKFLLFFCFNTYADDSLLDDASVFDGPSGAWEPVDRDKIATKANAINLISYVN